MSRRLSAARRHAVDSLGDPIVQIGDFLGRLSTAAIRGLVSDEQVDALLAPRELDRDRTVDARPTTLDRRRDRPRHCILCGAPASACSCPERAS